MIALVTDISALKHSETLLRESYERMRIAFGRTSQLLWEVDVASRTFGIWDLEKQRYDEDKVFRGVPAALLERGWVHQESREAFAAFFRSMLAGKAEDRAAFIIRYFATGQYGWATLSYRMIFDEKGSPVKAIGVSEELPNIFSEQLRFSQEKRLMSSLRFSLLAVMEANLTADSVLFLAISGKSRVSGRTHTNYTEVFEAGVSALFGPEDEAHYRARLSPEALRKAYADGVGLVTAEYRRRGREGKIRWTSSTVILLHNPVTRELHAFGYLRDIDRRRHWELALPSRVERSGVTHLYTRETSEAMIRSILRESEGVHALCALALVDIRGIGDILENTGESVADWILFSISRLFQLLLDSESVVGQIARDRLILFLPDAVSEVWVQKKIEDTISMVQRLRDAANMKERITFTAGIATARCSRADYETLFVQAAYVCENRADDRADRTATFNRAVSEERSLPSLAADGSFVQMRSEEEKRPLTADERETMFRCMNLMLSGGGYDASVKAILRTVGDYYGADRTYVLLLSPDGENVSLAYEWMARGRRSLMRRMTDVPVKKLPIVQKALKSGKILLQGPHADPADPYGFTIAPLLLKGKRIGVLCMENPRAHGGETALLLALIPLLLREREQYAKKGLIVGTSSRDAMTGLLGREAYEDALRSLSADALSSLGVLYMDINGLKSVNETQGHEMGDRLLLFAAKNLVKVFPHAAVYRVTGHEFAVLVQDITHEAFLGKCARAQEAFDLKYPDRFCLGYTWSEQDFTARKLAENAEEVMRLNKQSYFRALERSGTRSESAAMRELKAALAAGLYAVYIQPKARIRTGEIIGGEALVRYMDPKRGVVVPAEFIGRMEREHIIRELDFYVLEQTLRILHDWKATGKRLLPVSVNFSRQTLLDRSALPTVLAIHGRYDIPMELIEIEITESIGGIERETVAHAVETFRRHGFRLSLDDFGAEYSSMSVLATVPFDSVKLDKSIVGNFVS
ncbi:MAG TPA: EAL domain-containing protein, partial [Oscillospiraceae bacterium]|nr:EAL domain-containing protein [Oscillospiraceae bacterium]